MHDLLYNLRTRGMQKVFADCPKFEQKCMYVTCTFLVRWESNRIFISCLDFVILGGLRHYNKSTISGLMIWRCSYDLRNEEALQME